MGQLEDYKSAIKTVFNKKDKDGITMKQFINGNKNGNGGAVTSDTAAYVRHYWGFMSTTPKQNSFDQLAELMAKFIIKHDLVKSQNEISDYVQEHMLKPLVAYRKAKPDEQKQMLQPPAYEPIDKTYELKEVLDPKPEPPTAGGNVKKEEVKEEGQDDKKKVMLGMDDLDEKPKVDPPPLDPDNVGKVSENRVKKRVRKGPMNNANDMKVAKEVLNDDVKKNKNKKAGLHALDTLQGFEIEHKAASNNAVVKDIALSANKKDISGAFGRSQEQNSAAISKVLNRSRLDAIYNHKTSGGMPADPKSKLDFLYKKNRW